MEASGDSVPEERANSSSRPVMFWMAGVDDNLAIVLSGEANGGSRVRQVMFRRLPTGKSEIGRGMTKHGKGRLRGWIRV